MENLSLNPLQTSLENLNLDGQPKEVQEQFFDFFNNVPLIRSLVSPDRKRAKDLERDSDGKIIVDITCPHILEDMQYFRPAARHYELTGRYTDLRPNPNPNSEFGKWIREETRRCWEGYVRESDGEWIPGDLYFFWNYTPMSVSKRVKGKKKSQRVIGFPSIWEGHYLKAHYLEQARDNGKMAVELASRQKGKSFYGAAMLAKRFILGESKDVTERVVSYITATDKSKLSNGDQTLDKFQYDIDFIAQHMQWPARRLFNSLSDFNWQMGYKDLDSGTNRGTLNSVVGKSSQKDTASLIGSRGVLYLFEEAGYFSNLLGLWNNLLPSVMDNDDVYGMLYGYGTSGDDESDFSALQEIMYNPEGYKAYGVDNVYDKEGLGKKLFTYFFPGYLNLAGCYDENGNSDVTKALLTILLDRYKVKYNSSDPATIAKKIAHIPITPQEAILRVKGSIFPTVDITERINQLDNDTRVYDSVYIGDLVFNGSGQVEFVPTDDTPIRDFPLKDNKAAGAIEIYSMPKKDSTGKVPAGRYIVGHDPVDDDESNTMSLTSTFVLDLFTDEIVCEWTGRLQYADDNFERLRKICLFYNAKCMYEQNKKGAFAYFSMMSCLYLLADTPEYLKDKMIIKEIGFGNKAKGINATQPVNRYADKLTQQWLLKKTVVMKEIDGKEVEVEIPQLYTLKNRAFLKECLLYSPDINVDRVRAFGMLMLYREEFMILYGGNVAAGHEVPSDYLGNDKFFTVNYDDKKKLYGEMPEYVKRAFGIQ